MTEVKKELHEKNITTSELAAIVGKTPRCDPSTDS